MRRHWQTFWFGIILSLVFVAIIGLIGGRLNTVELLPDQGVSWYYWKLPERNFWSMVTVWSFYVTHQVLVWLFIWLAQYKNSNKRSFYRTCLYVVNIAFILLHIIQTHIWYDGLAQDVPVMSSQGSVIIMLVLILIMENNHRGLLFGKKITGFDFAKQFIRKYHGYFISWALVYTFWYHPTVSTNGHLVGFFYMFLLFIQMSMIYTQVHMNKKWIVVIELTVLFHGTLVAIEQGANMWPMFMFGFGFIFIATQVYGLKLKKQTIGIIQIIYIGLVLLIYNDLIGVKSFTDIHQVLWIPIIEYILVYVLLFVINGIGRLITN